MPHFSFSDISIKALAAATPNNIKRFDTSSRKVARLVKQLGVEQIHISYTEQTVVDLGFVALKQALAKAGWSESDLDMLIVNTQIPDFVGGAGDASLLHRHLGLKESCAFFDMNVGCAAFPFILSVAGSILSSQQHLKRIALVLGDSQWQMFKELELLQNTAFYLFGEGVAAVLLEKQEDAAPINLHLFGNGGGHDCLLLLPSLYTVWHQSPDNQYVMPNGAEFSNYGSTWNRFMDGVTVYNFSTEKISDAIKNTYPRDELAAFDFIAMHQANRQIVETLAANIGADQNKLLISLNQYGNTSSASIPISICHNYQKLQELQRPARIFGAGFGVGLSWGLMNFELKPEAVCPVVATDHHCEKLQIRPKEKEQAE